MILGINSDFRTISSAYYFDNYDLPCPVRVTISKENGTDMTLVLRKNRHGVIANEIRIFKVLRTADLPVPEILVEPFLNEEGEYVAVYSLLEGENLQKLSMRSESGLEQAKELLLDAVTRLMDTTDLVRRSEIGNQLPELTLESELNAISACGSPWLEETVFHSAMVKLHPVLSVVNTALVLTNGDYQPGNFLAKGGKITGFLDFESPSFQDPLMGFVKYPIYDMLPLSRSDIVTLFLKRNGFSKEDFDHRLALGCLKTLVKEVAISGGDQEAQEYRERVMVLLENSLRST